MTTKTPVQSVGNVGIIGIGLMQFEGNMSNTTYRGYRATDKPRCKSCQVFMPETPGENRVVCGNCGTPNMYRVDA